MGFFCSVYFSSFSFFFSWVFDSSALISLGLLLLLLRNEGCTFSFHCWFSTALEKAQGSCPLLFLASVVSAANDLHMDIRAFTSWVRSPHQSGKEALQCTLSVLCPFKGLWMIIDGILKWAEWIMHFWFSSQIETLWVGNEKENFGWMWKWFIWCKSKCCVVVSL